MQNFIDIIKERGFVHQMTDEDGLRELLETKGQTAYIGFDCTAKSLHVGSLLQIMLLRWWQKCGHRPIVLLGGGTTKIGDPSGKDESRPPLTDAQINENMESLKQVFSKFIEFGDDKAIMVNNDEWLSGLNYAQFLRDYGRHFSINRMLTMDSVKLRLEREQTLSFLEFNYMILQAYDFVELNKRHGCRVQMGGSDQWGNILQGIELNRRSNGVDYHKNYGFFKRHRVFNVGLKYKDPHAIKQAYPETKEFDIVGVECHAPYEDCGRPMNGYMDILYKVESKDSLFGITSPLLTTSSGAKMGKTASGAIWLNPDMLVPGRPQDAAYTYWNLWRNTEDGDVIRFLKLFTELPLEEIAEYQSWVGSAKINDAKIILATEVTAMLYGRDEAEKSKITATETFYGSGVSADLPEITAPSATPAVYELLVLAGFATSNGEARRLIKGAGVSVNDAKVTDDNARLSSADFAQGFAKLSKGKKQHVLVKIAN